jgi:hypothetical protein
MAQVGIMRLILITLAGLLAACGGAGDGGGPDQMPTIFMLPTADPTTTALNGRLMGVLLFWQPVMGELAAGESDRWEFNGQGGDQITLRAVGADLVLTLRSSDGDLIQQGEAIEAQLPTDDRYTVVVALSEPTTPGGQYELGLSYTGQAAPGMMTLTPLPEIVGVPTPRPLNSDLGTYISPIAAGESVGGELSEGAPPHLYTFEGRAGQFVYLELLRVGGTIDPVLFVYDPDGLPLAMDDNSAGERNAVVRNLRLAEDGLYTVQAAGDGFPGSYALRLLVNDAPAPITPTTPATLTPTPTFSLATPTVGFAPPGARLIDHAPVVGILSSADDVEIYSVDVAANQVITLGVIPGAGSPVQPRIEIIDPEGSMIAQAAASTSQADGAALITPLRLPIGGVYRVFVTTEGGQAGDFIISYGIGSTYQNVWRGTIEADQAVQSRFERRGQREVWSLALSEGDIISAAVGTDAASTLDPILELVRAENPSIVVAIDDNSGGGRNSLLNNIRINQSGQYLLRVRVSQAATTGDYSLIWRYANRAPTATAPPAVFPVLTVDDNVPDSQYRFYPFQGRAGQRLEIRVIGLDGFDPVAALIAPDGVVIAEADDSDGTLNPRISVTLPTDGSYNIRVNGYINGGAFELTVQEIF